jgi:hypothetical protein
MNTYSLLLYSSGLEKYVENGVCKNFSTKKPAPKLIGTGLIYIKNSLAMCEKVWQYRWWRMRFKVSGT